MQSPIAQSQPLEVTDSYIMSVLSDPGYALSPDDSLSSVTEPISFHSHFVDQMELYADACTVIHYFDNHHAWFERCAQPMLVQAIGANAYALTVGRYGAAGFELEPRIGLDLLPQANGVYRIETIPVPGYEPVGYQVDFKASMELVESSVDQAASKLWQENNLSEKITQVCWNLDLTVHIQFPRFIYTALPKSIIHRTGDQVLRQVVKQVSRRLTRKVQEDFCKTQNISLPKLQRRWFFQKSEHLPESTVD
jgi:hypothetical protein